MKRAYKHVLVVSKFCQSTYWCKPPVDYFLKAGREQIVSKGVLKLFCVPFFLCVEGTIVFCLFIAKCSSGRSFCSFWETESMFWLFWGLRTLSHFQLFQILFLSLVWLPLLLSLHSFLSQEAFLKERHVVALFIHNNVRQDIYFCSTTQMFLFCFYIKGVSELNVFIVELKATFSKDKSTFSSIACLLEVPFYIRSQRFILFFSFSEHQLDPAVFANFWFKRESTFMFAKKLGFFFYSRYRISIEKVAR